MSGNSNREGSLFDPGLVTVVTQGLLSYLGLSGKGRRSNRNMETELYGEGYWTRAVPSIKGHSQPWSPSRDRARGPNC